MNEVFINGDSLYNKTTSVDTRDSRMVFEEKLVQWRKDLLV